MSTSRLEKFIYAICSMEVSDLPAPLSRIEILWNCLITGETPDFEPQSRNEQYLMAMLGLYELENLPTPISRGEKLLYKIAMGETDLSDVPGYLSRYEELLKYLIENGGISGGDFEYVLYTLNQSLSTLYATVEKPVKSAILTGSTKYRDIDTGEFLEAFEEGRNLELVSVKMPVLTTTGKNIFGGELINGYINSSGNWGGSSDNIGCKDFISITPNDKVAISLYDESLTRVKLSTYVRFYDINFNAIGSNIYFANSQDVIATAPTNAKYLKFYYSGTTKLNVQIEQNSIITTYEPYKSNILTANEDVTLRSNGNVCDELDLLAGKLTQRIGEGGEVLSQEVVKTVDLITVDQDGQPTQLKTFNDITHVELSSEGLIPEVELEVATKINETLLTMSPQHHDISETQNKLGQTIDEQTENTDAAMLATTEIYEQTL